MSYLDYVHSNSKQSENMKKKSKGFFITGTDTGVGKTVATACLVKLLQQRSVDVGVMKPVETGVPVGATSHSTDAGFLKIASGVKDSITEISPYRFKTPTSPLQAAKIEGVSIRISQLTDSFKSLSKKHDRLLVEGIGGLMVPITKKHSVADLILKFRLPLIVISRTSLGTINHTLLTVKLAQSLGIEVRGILFNHTRKGKLDTLELDSIHLAAELSGVPSLGILPYLGKCSPDKLTPKVIKKIGGCVDLDQLL